MNDTDPDRLPHQLPGRRYDLLAALDRATRGIPYDGLEGEVHTELGRRIDRSVRGLLVPLDIPVQGRDLADPLNPAGQRGIERPWAEAIRGRTVIDALGSTFLSELAGDFALNAAPAGLVGWTARGTVPANQPAASPGTTLTPASVCATLDIPGSFLKQRSASAGDRLALDIAAALAGALDRATLAGAGQGAEPAGLLGAAGVTEITFGPDGAAPSYAKLVELEQAVGEAPGGGFTYGWVTTPAGRSKLWATQAFPFAGGALWEYNLVLHRPGFATDALPSDLTKGAGVGLSPLLYGAWEELVVARWSPAVELVVDALTFATAGLVRVTAVLDVAVGLRRPARFARAVDRVTAPATS